VDLPMIALRLILPELKLSPFGLGVEKPAKTKSSFQKEVRQ